MAKFVDTAELIITPEKSVLMVDGEEFPFHIAADDIEVVKQADGGSYVRVSVFADSIRVQADLGSAQPANVGVPILTIKPSEPEPTQPWAGMLVGDTIRLTPNLPEPPANIQSLEELGATLSPFLNRTSDGGWVWCEDADETPEVGEPWSTWVRSDCASYMNRTYRVVRADGLRNG